MRSVTTTPAGLRADVDVHANVDPDNKITLDLSIDLCPYGTSRISLSEEQAGELVENIEREIQDAQLRADPDDAQRQLAAAKARVAQLEAALPQEAPA